MATDLFPGTARPDPRRLRRLPLRATVCAAWLACVLPAAQAAITPAGSWWADPPLGTLGPGNTHLPTTAVWIGSGGAGSLQVDGGSLLNLGRLGFGSGGNGIGQGLVTGLGTQVQLLGDGASQSQVQRLVIGDWGNASVTVNGGALLSTRGNQAPCLLAFHYCDTFVGAAAGDTAVFNIEGSGTRVDLGQTLFVAQPGLAVQHLDGYTYGVPGGTTRGSVNLSGGAVLSTTRAQLAPDHWSTHATGFERNIADVRISGTGTRWEVTGGPTVNHANGQVFEPGANLTTAHHRNATVTLDVVQGGVLEIQGVQGSFNALSLTTGGGRTDARVSGAGSTIQFSGDAGVLHVGRSLGSAALSVSGGGQVLGAWYGAVGRDGSFAELAVDGVGSLLRLDGRASAAAVGQASGQAALLDIGRNGSGKVSVRNGGRIEVLATGAASNGPQLNLGRDAASAGTLEISGPGATVLLRSTSVLPGGGAGETINPFVRIGRDGSGTLDIRQGGQLLLDGQAVSTPTQRRSTALYIGGTADASPGGRGIARVDGAGSAIVVSGGDSFIGVGIGPGSNGQLSISQQGEVRGANVLSVGRSGGVGVMALDGGRLALSGQQTAGNLTGAALTVGTGGGVGVVTLANGSTVTLSNAGSSGAGFSLGGSANGFAGGDGSMTLSGGASLTVQAQPGLAAGTVGRDGSGFLRMRGASSVDLGGGSLYVGRLSGGDGTLIASEGSTVTAGWVGIGRNRTAQGNEDGGTGTLVLVNSQLLAQDIVIGTNGFLGGTGTITGNVTNWGIFAPGNSPGTLRVDGDFSAMGGSRMVLEVQADGHGGFLTDQVIFGAGRSVDLGGLAIEFRFLGGTDPNAFAAQAGAFDIDGFLRQADGQGGTAALADGEFDQVVFSARAERYVISNFSYSAAGGAVFTATPVPEPATWASMLAGLALLGGLLGRRRAARGDSATA